ncbi:MAG: PEP-utilizing enzyme [Patescibacteria group bacterium]
MWAHSPKARELGFKRAGSQYLILNPASFLEKDGLNTEVYDTVYGELVQGKSSTAEKLFAHAKEIEDEIAAHTATIRTDPSSEENLVKALLLYERGVFPAMTTDHMGNAAEKLIEDTIAKQGLDSAAVYSNIRDLKSLPLYDFDVQRELKEALEALGLGRDVTYTEVEQRDPALAARIQAHQQETEYMGTHNVQGSPRTMDKFLHGLFDVAPAFSVAPMAVEMPASLQAALKVAEQAIYWRTQMGEVMTRMMYATKPAMENLAKKFDMTFEELTYATHLEIIDAVTNGAAIDKTQCLARMQNYGLVAPADERRVDVFVGATFDALQEKFGLKTVVEMAGEIQGKTAYKGKARGRAVVLMRASDGDQLLPGDILVAAETTPDYILAMNRAAAFVTDRGGITSHAAIIAREMRKPCIIATKVGTQVLKTGDMVEVDADHGVVRKIS